MKKLKLIHVTVMFILAFTGMGIMIAEMFLTLSPSQSQFLFKVTVGIIILFGVEMLVLLVTSKDRLLFIKKNWYGFLVLIPPLKAIKYFKLFKAIKTLKVYKTIKIGKKLKNKTKSL